MIGAVLVVTLGAALGAVSPEEVQLLSGALANAAARDVRLNVLSADDLRTALEVEGSRQLAGCDEASCMAEIAAALDARFILRSTLGQLGESKVLQLIILDTDTALAVARGQLSGSDIDSVAGQLDGAVATMLASADFGDRVRAGLKERLVVLDVTATTTTTATSAPSSAAPVLLIAGGSAVGLGVVAASVGVFFDLDSVNAFNGVHSDLDVSARDARAAYARSDDSAVFAAVAYGVGAVLVVGGAIAASVALLQMPADASAAPPASSSVDTLRSPEKGAAMP
jgi:hypothetical protein